MLTAPMGFAQFYNGSIMDFGKNRVQYQDFAWRYLRYARFDCYYYQGGEDLAEYVGKKAALFVPEMERALEFNLENPIQFIVYKSHTDFKQSNIGITGDESTNIGGSTRIVGNKVFVFYEGDHRLLDRQIRSGIAQIMIEEALYGGSIREMVRNSTLLHLPDWYTAGLTAYLSGGWDEHAENQTRDGVLAGRYNNFNQLEGNEAEIAGLSIWNFIAEVYGEKVIPNIVYMTRMARNVESGFLYVLGLNLEQFTAEYLNFYKSTFQQAEEFRNEIELSEVKFKQKKNRTYQQFKISPNGKYAAYASTELGQYRVYLLDMETKKTKQILKRDHKIERVQDKTFPTLCWSPNSEALAFTSEYKGKLQLNFYFLSEREVSTREVFQMDKILSMSYANDGKLMVLSGVYNGQTDLYRYYVVGNRQEKLTDDIYEDLSPRFIANDRKIIFASNRPSDTLNLVPARPPQRNDDIFILPLDNSGRLERITQTKEQNEALPAEYGPDKYTFISNKNGIINRFFAALDSSIASVDTTIRYTYFTSTSALSNFNRNIKEYNVNLASDLFSITAFSGGKNRFYTGKLSEDQVVSLSEMKISTLKSIKQIDFDNPDSSRTVRDKKVSSSPVDSERDAYRVLVPDTGQVQEIDINNYEFGDVAPRKTTPTAPSATTKPPVTESRNDSTNQNQPTKSILDAVVVEEEKPQYRAYQINFATDQVLTQIDNTYNNQFYQLLTGPDNINPGLSGFFKLAASDLFEDYKIMGGFRSSVNINSFDYLLTFQDLKKKSDHLYLAQRQNQLLVTETSLIKVITYSGFYERKYPFSEVAALKGSVRLRYDQATFLSTDQPNLMAPNFQQYQAGLKLEYVYDNTLRLGTNLLTGTRGKAWIEHYREPGVDQSQTQVVGFDVRHYEKLHRCMILATRLSGSTSWGNRRLIYYLGGVDRWIYLPGSDPATPFPNDDRFYYQALASPLRGALRNVRNGNSFAALNAEVRLPVARYFSKKPLKSAFLESFQVVGFSDVGTAWTGTSPYSDDNQFNNTIINGNPISARIRSQREPIVAGYGFGLRGKVLGYFLRADWAWSLQDGLVTPREFYLSLSLDF